MAVHGGFVDGPAATGGFHEEDHPRDAKGEFAGKGGSKDAKGKVAGAGTGTGGKGSDQATSVSADPGTRASMREFFGRDVSDDEIQGLLGAPPGATISIDNKGGGHLTCVANHPLYEQPHICALVNLPWGGKMVQLELYHLKPSAPPGMGTNAFSQMVNGARSLGMEAIHIPIAARVDAPSQSDKMVGYYVWPRLGADGDIPKAMRSKLPESLKDATKLSDLMRTTEGKEWWKSNGKTVSCTFLTDPESVSSQVLSAYLSEKKKGKTVN